MGYALSLEEGKSVYPMGYAFCLFSISIAR